MKKIIGLAMVLVLALGVTGCGGGGGNNDPIFPIEVSSGKVTEKAGEPPYFAYTCDIKIKNISDDECTYKWDLELYSGEKVYTQAGHTYNLDTKHSDTLTPWFSKDYQVNKVVLVIAVGTETKRFNIPIVTQ